MKKEQLYTEERREQIIQYINHHSRCSVSELSDLFNCTSATIRSDLNHLEEIGKLTRTHGGAVLRNNIKKEESLEERKFEDRKIRVTAQAISLLSDGDSISIDNGTTTYHLAKQLVSAKVKNLKIVTNDLKVATIVGERDDFNIYFIGGSVRPGFHFCWGGSVTDEIANFSVDKAFISTSAFDFVHGLSTPSVENAKIKNAFFTSASEIFILTDSSKFHKVCFAKFGNLKKVDKVITDDQIDNDTLKELRSVVKQVIIAK